MQFARSMCTWAHEMPYSREALIWFVNTEIARTCLAREWIEVKLVASEFGLTVNGFLLKKPIDPIHVVFDLVVRAFSDYLLDWTDDSVIIAWFKTTTAFVRFNGFWVLQEEIDAARNKRPYRVPPWRSNHPNSPGHLASQYLCSLT